MSYIIDRDRRGKRRNWDIVLEFGIVLSLQWKLDKDVDVGRSSVEYKNFVIKYKVELIGKLKKKWRFCIISYRLIILANRQTNCFTIFTWNRTYIFHLVFRYLEWIKGPQLYQAFINLDRTACTRFLLFKMSRTKILQTLAIRLSRCESVLNVRL